MPEAARIDGKVYSERLRAQVAAEVARLKADHGLTPGLAVVLVGEDPASQIYVRNKARDTREAGMTSFEHRLPARHPALRTRQAQTARPPSAGC